MFVEAQRGQFGAASRWGFHLRCRWEGNGGGGGGSCWWSDIGGENMMRKREKRENSGGCEDGGEGYYVE